jgi:multiple sugar transport system substrate-binding protein
VRRVPTWRRLGVGAVGALAAASLVLAGCGSGSAKAGSAGGDTGTITFWHAYSADSQEVKTLTDVIIPGFKAKHPGVDVKQVSIPYDELHQKLLTAAAGADLPDVMRSDIAWVSELAKLGLLEQLDTGMSDYRTLSQQTFPGALATNMYKGHYYGLPLDTNTRVMMYNQAALAKAGVSGAPKNFDDLRALAGKLSGKGVYAFADNGLSGWNVLPWIWSAGGDITNPDYTKATGYLNSANSVAGVQLLVDLYKQKQLPAIVLGGTGGVPTSDGLATGKYATILDGPWMYPIFASSHPDFKLQVAPVPAGPGGSISVVGGEDTVVFKQSRHKALAEEFSRYLLSQEAQLAFAKVGQMSVLKDLDVTSVNPTYAPFVEQLKTARPRPPVPNWQKINDLLQAKLQSAVKGDLTVQQALDQAAAETDTLLAQG